MGPAGPGIAGGVIAGIVVAVVVLVIALVAVIIVLVILYDRFRYNGELGPPPSRKGSVRLVSYCYISKGWEVRWWVRGV